MAAVVFVGGAGRSGTTLLDRLLGSASGHFSAGELCYIWTRSYAENQLCGCGRPFRDCPVWKPVVARAFGGDADAKFQRGAKLAEQLRQLTPRALARQARTPETSREAALREYGELIGTLLDALVAETSARVVIDSSKAPWHGLALASARGIDLHVVHVVRDPRAVAFSWTRKKERPEVQGKKEFMPSMGPVESSVGWVRNNMKVESLEPALSKDRYHRVRYEDLLASPRTTIERLLGKLDAKPLPEVFATEGAAELGVQHTVSGNPMRFKVGRVDLQLDTEWTQNMRASDWWKATIASAPLLARYGYKIRRPRG